MYFTPGDEILTIEKQRAHVSRHKAQYGPYTVNYIFAVSIKINDGVPARLSAADNLTWVQSDSAEYNGCVYLRGSCIICAIVCLYNITRADGSKCFYIPK